MGIDLKLLPVFNIAPMPDGGWLCHDMLCVGRDRELWDAIETLPWHDILGPVHSYLAQGDNGDPCYGEVMTDPYGERLNWTTAGALASLREHAGVRGQQKNRAIWAMLSELPEDWPVVLYWC